jgi:hypothetical protein
MTDPSKQGEQEVKAFIHRIGPIVVFLHTVSPQESAQGKSESSVGTGFLVQFRGCKYFVSALHNFFYKESGLAGVKASWESARFKFHGKMPVNFEDASSFQRHRLEIDTGVSLPNSFPDCLLINSKRDLIAVRLNSNDEKEKFEFAHFVNLEEVAFTEELQDKMSLVTLGNPFDGRIPISESKSALIPHLDHVLYDANLDTSWASSSLWSTDYFFMPYSIYQEQIEPGGFSGAPVFAQGGTDDEPVWTANPRVVGVVLRYSSKRHTIVAVKIKVVIEMLEAEATHI